MKYRRIGLEVAVVVGNLGRISGTSAQRFNQNAIINGHFPGEGGVFQCWQNMGAWLVADRENATCIWTVSYFVHDYAQLGVLSTRCERWGEVRI